MSISHDKIQSALRAIDVDQENRRKKMNRRNLIKSLLPMTAFVLFFKNEYCAYEPYFYKGKKLIIVSADALNDICMKEKILLPTFQSNNSIMDDMKMFVDMSNVHTNDLGQKIYGCIHKDGSYSIASFS